ncbi:PaaI family thioesterase [Acidovorax sp. SUPP2825]|uniref:PaaI family thioesterase n=1 Tax=Acidovorax sp. SUPP2825 TaxID=2920879 RepID=UPI0023DE584A|nr:PaaI family thioesterase [Acidovorax sp. SUPP2825]GKS96275.1 PaaI family thioesterase [Acidovorax sp. SUPP2825]
MLSFGVEIPFVDELGFTLHHMKGGASELHYEARPEHMNSFDVTHGGASMTLLDVAMATAARSDTPDFGVVTIEMKTSFMQPARGPLVARGRLIHRTVSMAFTEGTVTDAEGRVCCHATGTFKYVRRKPAQPGASEGAGATEGALPTD